MKAALIHRFGPPEVLTISEVPVPPVGDSDVLIRTEVIGLNFADIFARLGYYPAVPKPPFVPGIELSGVVERKGKAVRELKVGDRVLAFTRQKGYAEYVSVPSAQAARIPKRMGFKEAAAFGVTSLTAYHGLVTLGNMTKGDRVLVHAAAGGVGIASLQLARHFGAIVYATVGSASKMELVRSLGAELVTNYSEDDFAEPVRRATNGEGVDIVFDSVGGRVFRKGWKLLAPMGRYVLFGFAAVADHKGIGKLRAARESLSVPLIFPPALVSKNVSLMGFNLYFLIKKKEYLRSALKILFGLYERGVLRPMIGAEYPFENIVEAHRFLQSRKSVGKVILTMGK
jgi:NADPH:quinone reductase-like Zn-dependent oxidoreductase